VEHTLTKPGEINMEYLIRVERTNHFKVQTRCNQVFDGRRWVFIGYFENKEHAEMVAANASDPGKYGREARVIELKTPKITTHLV
jgi:hypothetical protein